MVKATQEKLRKRFAASKTESTTSTKRNFINCNNAKATTTTTSLKNKVTTQVFGVRKCVVKIKRFKLQAKDVRKSPPSAPTTTDTECDVSVFEPARNSTMCPSRRLLGNTITPCRVRIRRNTSMQINSNQKPQQEQDQAQDQQETVTASKQTYRFFHRDQPPARTRSSVTRHVYEFLSQSQIEDNEVRDPAADIIQKMVADGRACVMTRLKTGKSRMRPVRKKVRPVGKRKQCSVRSIAEKPPIKVSEAPQRPLSPIFEPQDDASDADIETNPAVRIEVPVQVHAQPAATPNRTLVEGVYSPLARTLLLNQTKTHNPQTSEERRRQLLNMAKKFISTPINRKSNSAIAANNTNLSPINNSGSRTMAPVATVRSPSGGSPWRVPDEAPLPNTFVFGLNTSQLPSYSSDFIPSRHVYVPDDPAEESICPPAPNDQTAGSFANDSNGENVPPPAAPVAEEPPLSPFKPSEEQENENAENFVQLPNPRRTLQHRSPLKDINILDVVVLPSWKKNVQLPKTPIRQSMARTHDHSSPRPQSARTERRQQQPGNLFGFEDFLSGDEEEHTQMRAASQNVTLHEKLQRLKGLRPTKLPPTSGAPLRHACDDLISLECAPKQRSIKEMLCSTMIARPARLPSADESASLFTDIDPEATFDEKQPRRTYVRERPKRKRKQRVHVLFIDSDSSEDEENEQDSGEMHDGSPRKAPPQKRTRKDVEHEAKLQQFITSFNQECAEVDKFPLIIE